MAKQEPVQRVTPSADPQVQAMITDPAAYFASARSAARREARIYVRTRAQHPRPA